MPEKREELTTEGGLDVVAHKIKVKDAVTETPRSRHPCQSVYRSRRRRKSRQRQEVGAHAIEIHTGAYCNVASGGATAASWRRSRMRQRWRAALDLEVHGGHGLDYENVLPIAKIPEIVELNIGHSIIARAVIVGIEQAVREMKELLNQCS